MADYSDGARAAGSGAFPSGACNKAVDDWQRTHRILQDVRAERSRQDKKFPDQALPFLSNLGEGSYGEAHMRTSCADRAAHWQSVNDNRSSGTYPESFAWDGILLEEVYEALAEADPIKRRAELVQVAAVAVRIIEQIDREADASA